MGQGGRWGKSLCGKRLDQGAQFCTGVAHPTGFEPVAFAFGGQRSIQLSYGCLGVDLATTAITGKA